MDCVLSGKGRGLVASRNVTAGEVLLVTRALVYLEAQPDEPPIPDMQSLLDKSVTIDQPHDSL